MIILVLLIFIIILFLLVNKKENFTDTDYYLSKDYIKDSVNFVLISIEKLLSDVLNSPIKVNYLAHH